MSSKSIPTKNTNSGVAPISIALCEESFLFRFLPAIRFQVCSGLIKWDATGNRDSRRATHTLAKQFTDELQQRQRSIDDDNNKEKHAQTMRRAVSGSGGDGGGGNEEDNLNNY